MPWMLSIHGLCAKRRLCITKSGEELGTMSGDMWVSRSSDILKISKQHWNHNEHWVMVIVTCKTTSLYLKIQESTSSECGLRTQNLFFLGLCYRYSFVGSRGWGVDSTIYKEIWRYISTKLDGSFLSMRRELADTVNEHVNLRLAPLKHGNTNTNM